MHGIKETQGQLWLILNFSKGKNMENIAKY